MQSKIRPSCFWLSLSIITLLVSATLLGLVTYAFHYQMFWNVNAVKVDGAISGIDIVNRTVNQQCNANCVGACTMCDVPYYDGYITIAYLTYEYRMLIIQDYNNYTTLLAVMRETIKTTVPLYYNKINPRDVSLSLHEDVSSRIIFIVLMAIVCLIINCMIISCSIRAMSINNSSTTPELTVNTTTNNSYEPIPLSAVIN